MSDKKAMVKDTEKVFDVDQHFTVRSFSMEIEYDIDSEELKDVKDSTWVFNGDTPQEGEYYKLSDGKTYSVDDVVVGSDNIRDYKINKLI